MTIRKVIFPVLLLTVVLMLWTCRQQPAPEPADLLLHQPIWLGFDTTRIWYSDFMPPDVEPDSVVILGHKVTWTAGEKSFVYSSLRDAPPVFPMHLWHQGNRTDVVLKKSRAVRISYRFDPGGKTYDQVSLKGEFNGWTPSRTPLSMKDGVWEASLTVPEGKYQYLLVADGAEMLDPGNPEKVSNNMGGFNSVLVAGDAKKGNVPLLVTSETTGRKVMIKTQYQPESIIVLWNNQALESGEYKTDNEILTVKIPKSAKKKKRTWIRVFAWNESGTGNDLLIPLDFGQVVVNSSLLTRTDMHSAIMYNVFVDRFFNGNPANDKHLPDSLVLPKANYYGGDLAGVLQKAEEGYFKDLGVNTLWLSPVVKNADGPYGQWNDPPTKFSSYHGYWPVSFTETDTHFGTAEELKALSGSLHKAGMNILLDFVAHHVHQDHPYFKANPDIATNLYLPDGSLNTERWDEHRLTTWFDVFLPTLNLERAEVAHLVSDSTVWWLNEFQLDGFRHDAAKHIPLSFWRMLTDKIRRNVVYAEKRPVYQIGETYGSTELIGSYLGSGLLDAQFDFNVFDAALGAFAGGQPFGLLSQRMEESMQYYGFHNLMGNITGNQDRARFISYAGGDLKFEENAKAAGWQREIGVGDPAGYNRLQMMMAFIMTIPGIPVIYYGDEIGMPGGNDPDCRRMMRFGNELSEEEAANLKITQKLTELRKQNMALMYGDISYKQVSDHTFVFARTWFGNTVIVLFNNSFEPAELKVDVNAFAPGKNFLPRFGSRVKAGKDFLTLSLPGNSFEILINQ